MGLGDAQRLINTIRQAIAQETKSASKVEFALGEVAATYGNYADVYVNGDTDTASQNFRVPAYFYVNVGDPVMVAIDYGSNLGKWIVEVLPVGTYSQLSVNPNTGEVYTSDGETAPEAGSLGGAHPDLATHDALGLATDAELAEHTGDTSDAHDASAISIADAGNDFTATDVEGALAELQSDHEADSTALSDHLSDTSDAHDASAISIADAGNDFTATDVEGALAELQSDHEADATALSDHISDTSAAHAASAISFTPNGSIAATDVQAAIQEVRDEASSGPIIKTKRVSKSVTNNTADTVTVTWDSAFADTNYTIMLSVDNAGSTAVDETKNVIVEISSYTASAVVVRIANNFNSTITFVVHAVGIHD